MNLLCRKPHLWTYVAHLGKYLSQTYCFNCLLASIGNGFYTWYDIHLSKTEQSAVAPLPADEHKVNFIVRIFGFYVAIWTLLSNKEACLRQILNVLTEMDLFLLNGVETKESLFQLFVKMYFIVHATVIPVVFIL